MASSRGAMVTVGQASYGSTNVLAGYNFLSGNIVCIFFLTIPILNNYHNV